MSESIPNENEKDLQAKIAWSELVEYSGGDFNNLYLIGTLHGENKVTADVRLYKIPETRGGGYWVYINDISAPMNQGDVTASEVDMVVSLVKDLKNKGIDIKRIKIQASSGASKRLQTLVDTNLAS